MISLWKKKQRKWVEPKIYSTWSLWLVNARLVFFSLLPVTDYLHLSGSLSLLFCKYARRFIISSLSKLRIKIITIQPKNGFYFKFNQMHGYIYTYEILIKMTFFMNYFLICKINFIINNFDVLHYVIIHMFFIKKPVLNQLLVKMESLHLVNEKMNENLYIQQWTT